MVERLGHWRSSSFYELYFRISNNNSMGNNKLNSQKRCEISRAVVNLKQSRRSSYQWAPFTFWLHICFNKFISQSMGYFSGVALVQKCSSQSNFGPGKFPYWETFFLLVNFNQTVTKSPLLLEYMLGSSQGPVFFSSHFTSQESKPPFYFVNGKKKFLKYPILKSQN